MDQQHAHTATPRFDRASVPVLRARRETVATPGVSWLSTVALMMALMAFIDRPLAEFCRRHEDAAHAALGAIGELGQCGWYLVPSLFIYAASRWLVRRPAIAAQALFVFLGVALAGLGTDLIKVLVGRARPWMLFRDGSYGFWPLQMKSDFQSFPSGHAACAVAAALTLAVLAPRYRFPLLLGALLVALARVLTVAHYASDVVGGAALASLVVTGLKLQFERHGMALAPRGAAAGSPPSTFARRLFGSDGTHGARPSGSVLVPQAASSQSVAGQ